MRIPLEERSHSTAVAVKPFKVLEVFEDTARAELDLDISKAVTALMVYLIRNKTNKKLKEVLWKIRKEIDSSSLNVKPSF